MYAKEEARLRNLWHPPFRARVKAQGPWDEANDPMLLASAPARPMPVNISEEESLAPFLAHIGDGGTVDTQDVEKKEEPFHRVGVRMVSWIRLCQLLLSMFGLIVCHLSPPLRDQMGHTVFWCLDTESRTHARKKGYCTKTVGWIFAKSEINRT